MDYYELACPMYRSFMKHSLTSRGGATFYWFLAICLQRFHSGILT